MVWGAIAGAVISTAGSIYASKQEQDAMEDAMDTVGGFKPQAFMGRKNDEVGMGQVDINAGILKPGKGDRKTRRGAQNTATKALRREDKIRRKKGGVTGRQLKTFKGADKRFKKNRKNIKKTFLHGNQARKDVRQMGERGDTAMQDFRRNIDDPRMRESAQGDLAASNQAREALGNFDPDAMASEQFDRLNRLSAPGEETATSNQFNNLFGSGRLGTSGGARDVGQLDLSQRQARDARLGQAIGLAGAEGDRLASRASQFGQDAGNKLGFDQNFRQGLFERAGTGQQDSMGANRGFQEAQEEHDLFRRTRTQDRFDLSNRLVGTSQEMRGNEVAIGGAAQTIANDATVPAFNLANVGLRVGESQAEADAAVAGLQADAGASQADSTSSMFGGIGGAIGGLF